MAEMLNDYPRCISVIVLLLITVGLHFVVKRFSKSEDGEAGDEKVEVRGLWGLIVGMDGRVSTSKLQVVLWTYTVVFGLLALMIVGWNPDAKDPGLDLSQDYLLLLGSPAAAALLAKASTTYKVENKTISKTDAEEAPEKNPVSRTGQGIMETVSDDQGKVDVFDFQYFLFTLIGLTFFFGTFLTMDLIVETNSGANGPTLPDIPDILVAMSGVSAAAYSAKKVTERSVPVLTAIFPSAAAAGDMVWVRGANLKSGEDPSEPDEEPESEEKKPMRKKGVMFDGQSAGRLEDFGDDGFKVRVPESVSAEKPISVTFMRSDGAVTAGLPFQVIVSRPVIRSVNQKKIIPGSNGKLRIFGYGFGEKPGILTLDGRRLREVEVWEDDEIVVSLLDIGNDGTLPNSGKVELVVNDAKGRESAPMELELIRKPTPDRGNRTGQTTGGNR